MTSNTTFDVLRSPLGTLEDIVMVGASAGTGKTWTITHFAARWMIEEDHLPHELLMVTFSRAAARELKTRLRERVLACRDVIHQLETNAQVDPDADDWAIAFADRVATVGVAVARERCNAIVAELDDVHARTIHSFAGAVRNTGDNEMTSGTRWTRRAVNETLTRLADSRDPGFGLLVDTMEDESSGVTPAAERLQAKLIRALDVVEGGGGFDDAHVDFASIEMDAVQTERAETAVRILRDAHERLRALRELEHVATFNELLMDIHAQLRSHPTALVERLRAQFRLVMIDEFQDTDALQWNVFQRLFREGPSPTPMVIVGDAKQAIYGFRGGDVKVYQSLRHELAHSTTSTLIDLQTNYRSAPPLLDALNALFLAGRRHGWHLSSGPEPIEYDPVVPSPRQHDRRGHFHIRRTDATTVGADIFRDVHATIVALTASGVPARDIAILLRRGVILRQLQRYLARRGVVAVSLGGSSVFTSTAASQLRVLLWSLCHPHDPRRLALLATTWFRDVPTEDLRDLLHALPTTGVSALSRVVVSGRVLAIIRTTSEGERHWTDLEHVTELAAKDLAGPATPQRLLRWLDEHISDAQAKDDDGDSAQRRIESDDDAVRLMTIHASKGLEFPLVLVPDIERTGHLRTDGVAAWSTGERRVIDPRSLTSSEGFAGPVSDDDRDETRRLIYVALTRAESLLVAWVHEGAAQFKSLIDAFDAEASDNPGREAASGPLISTLDLPFVPPASDLVHDPRPARTAPRVRRAPRVPEINRRWSYSALHVHADATSSAEAGGVQNAVADDERALDEGLDAPVLELSDLVERPGAFAFGEWRGTDLGNAVHSVLESVVGVVPSSSTHFEQVVTRTFESAGLSPADYLVPVFSSLLRRPLGEMFDGACLDDFVGTHRTSREMRFTLPLADGPARARRLAEMCDAVVQGDAEGPYVDFFRRVRDEADPNVLREGYLTGSIDLVVEIPGDPPRFVVVDYKTNLVTLSPDYSPSSLVREMSASGYPLQGLLYSVALHRFLRDRLPDYDADRHLGGLAYLYLRGLVSSDDPTHGIATWSLPANVVRHASDILAGETR